jgi:hypothetical protein
VEGVEGFEGVRELNIARLKGFELFDVLNVPIGQPATAYHNKNDPALSKAR